MTKQSRDILFDEAAESKLFVGLETAYRVACAAYGPNAGNVLIEQPYGDPLLSRDGVTNLEKVYCEDAVENMGARVLAQASRKTNKKVGDGTSAVAILGYHLYKAARRRIGAGENRMKVARELDTLVPQIITQIDATKKNVDDKLLQHVAVVSAGDNAIGQMIADIINEVGSDGGVTVEDFAGIGIYNELVEGFYWRKGFTNPNLITDPVNLESRHENVPILICDKKLALTTDIAPILEKIVASGIKELVIVGDVSDEVLNLLILNRLHGNITCTVCDLPVFGAMRTLILDDLATITGGKVLATGTNASDFNVDMLGAAGKVIVNEFSTTVINGDGAKEDIEVRIKELSAQLKEADSPVTVEALRDRLGKLTGKVAIIRVGGATELEQGEVKLRVQDAICAVQAAIKDGVVPGGGATLARISENIDSPFAEALQQPFRQLVGNAGFNTEKALSALQEASKWHTFDLRADELDEAQEALKLGIIDPALVIKEVVRNACSTAARLLTNGATITYTDRTMKHD